MTEEKEPTASHAGLLVADAIDMGGGFGKKRRIALALDAWGEALLKRQADLNQLRKYPPPVESAERATFTRQLADLSGVLANARIERDKAEAELEATKRVNSGLREELLGSQVAEARVTRELEATKAELTKRHEDYADLAATHEATCAELESLRKPLEGELARKVETVRESLLEYVGTPNSAELHALDAIEAELARLRSNANPVGVAGYPGVRAEFCRACANYPCNCAASLEGELAEDVATVRQHVNNPSEIGLTSANQALCHIESALRAKSDLLEEWELFGSEITV